MNTKWKRRRLIAHSWHNARRCCLHVAALLLTAGTATLAYAQAPNNPQRLKPVLLNVVATDHAGSPVTDLQPSDFRLVDGKAQQQITSLSPSPGSQAPALVILLDLTNLNLSQRAASADRLRESLPRVPNSTSLYLYLLVANGSVYSIRGLRLSPSSPATAADATWVQHVGPLIDQALKKASQARMPFAALPTERFKKTYAGLDSMNQELSRFPGRKQLLWITDGIPSTIRLAGQGAVDFSPHLLELAAQFSRSQTAIYTLDPSLALASPNREGLEVLSAATGGRTFASSDLNMALRQVSTDASSGYLLEYGPVLAENWEGKSHTVSLSCSRKGVRLISQQIYLAEVEK
jgi:VWFA-related protein